MKRLFSIFSVVVLLAGCTNFEEQPQLNPGGEQNGDAVQSIYAGFADEESRAYVENDKDILWQNGDAISYFAPLYHAQYCYNGVSGETTAKMDLAGEPIAHSHILYTHALYPYDENATCTYVDSEHKISTNFPAEQNYAQNSFGRGANVMVAAGTIPDESEQNLYFRSACGFFVIQLYGKNVTVKSVKLTALGGEKIAGPATIIASNNTAPQTTMSNEATSEILLNCNYNDGYVALSNSKDEPTEFWFALPPTTFERGVKIEVTDSNDKVSSVETSKKIVVERNKIKPMSALKIEESVPDNTLWYTLNSGSTSKFDWGTASGLFNAAISSYYYDSANQRFVVKFASTLTTIKADAFKDLSDLKTIALPKHVTTIEELAFANCINLTSIEMPTSLKTIGTNAFRKCNSLQSIIIPASVESIGDDAFFECSSLKSVRVEDADTPLNIGLSYGADILRINRGPFYFSPLQEIYVGRNIQSTSKGSAFRPTTWDEGAFANEYYNADNATAKVTIGPKVTILSDYMFSCLPITEVTIPDSITYINRGVFAYCDKLTAISIPASVTVIRYDAFYGCESMHTVRIEDSDTPIRIGCSLVGSRRYGPFYDSPLQTIYCGRDVEQAQETGELWPATTWDSGTFAHKFYDDVDVKVTIGSKVTTLPNYMFAYLPITEIVIPNGVTTLRTSVFEGCDNLTAISIPASVELIDKNAFYGCSGLNSVRIEDGDNPIKICYIYMSYYKWGPFYDSPLSNIYCGRNIVQIDQTGEIFTADAWDKGVFANKFYNDNSITTSLSIGPKVIMINDYMFSRVRMRYFYIYPSVLMIGHCAFSDCSLLEGLSCNHTTPPALSAFAFENCKNIYFIKVPEEAIDTFKNAPNWSAFNRDNRYGQNIYRAID